MHLSLALSAEIAFKFSDFGLFLQMTEATGPASAVVPSPYSVYQVDSKAVAPEDSHYSNAGDFPPDQADAKRGSSQSSAPAAASDAKRGGSPAAAFAWPDDPPTIKTLQSASSWNERFLSALAISEFPIAKYSAIAQLSQDFVETAATLGKIIITE